MISIWTLYLPMAITIAVTITVLAVLATHYAELHWRHSVGRTWPPATHYIIAMLAISLGPALVLVLWGLLLNGGAMRMGLVGSAILTVVNAIVGVGAELATRPLDAMLERRRKQLLAELSTRRE